MFAPMGDVYVNVLESESVDPLPLLSLAHDTLTHSLEPTATWPRDDIFGIVVSCFISNFQFVTLDRQCYCGLATDRQTRRHEQHNDALNGYFYPALSTHSSPLCQHEPTDESLVSTA